MTICACLALYYKIRSGLVFLEKTKAKTGLYVISRPKKTGQDLSGPVAISLRMVLGLVLPGQLLDQLVTSYCRGSESDVDVLGCNTRPSVSPSAQGSLNPRLRFLPLSFFGGIPDTNLKIKDKASWAILDNLLLNL